MNYNYRRRLVYSQNLVLWGKVKSEDPMELVEVVWEKEIEGVWVPVDSDEVRMLHAAHENLKRDPFKHLQSLNERLENSYNSCLWGDK